MMLGRIGGLLVGLGRRWQQSFALRLTTALLGTLLVVGIAGFALIRDRIGNSLVQEGARLQSADANSVKALAAGSTRPRVALLRIDQLLDSIGRRPGNLEVLLIDRRGVIVAASDDKQEGKRDHAPRVLSALRSGHAFAGRESDRGKDRRHFEFITPVDLPSGRYAFEVTQDYHLYDAELAGVGKSMLWIGLLLLAGALPFFWLIGGRSLVRTHRYALQRATKDGLTGLGNHRAFKDELHRAVALAARSGEALWLVMFDIDDFKFLNDRRGHTRGDAALVFVAGALSRGRLGDRAFRIGGDEFALILHHADGPGAERATERVRCLVAERGGVLISAGIGELRPGMQDAETLHQEADAALLEGKRRGGNTIVAYGEIRDLDPIRSPEAVRRVRDLLVEGDLSVAFQPIWDLDRSELVGLEALARPAPRYGFSGPAEAFDIAEQIGRVHELDVLCIKTALAQAHALPPEALLFVNLAPHTIDLDSNADDWLSRAVEAAGLQPERIVVELTERSATRLASVTKGAMRLHSQGFRLALDDVGSGNSGLEMLRQIKFDFVKIDRSVVREAQTDLNARGVLCAINAFAIQSGAFVIAEGIEDEEMLEFVRDLDGQFTPTWVGIRGGQGFGLGRPNASIDAALTAWKPTPAHTVSARPIRDHDGERLRDRQLIGTGL